MKKKAICAGHVCLDITPVIEDTQAVYIGDVLSPGKLVDIGEAVISPGGSVTNTGLCMKKLGADVSLMGKVGTDAFGKVLKELFASYGIEDSLICSRDVSTSYSTILVIPGIDRVFLHHSGANHTFCTRDIPWEKVNESALFHFGYPTVMRSMYQSQGDELVQLMRSVKEADVSTSLDMSSIDPDSEAGKLDWECILERVLPYVDFFEPSVEELCYMLNRTEYYAWRERAKGRDICSILDVERDIRPLADRCMEMGAKVLLLKCGVPGMVLRTADETALQKIGSKLELDAGSWSNMDFFQPSFVPDRVVSATGAGDTSIGAFLTAVLNGEKPMRAVQIAAAAGACCVSEMDSLSGIPTLAELERKIDAGWKNQL